MLRWQMKLKKKIKKSIICLKTISMSRFWLMLFGTTKQCLKSEEVQTTIWTLDLEDKHKVLKLIWKKRFIQLT